MAKTVKVDAKTLRLLLERVAQSAKVHHARYKRKLKSWPWNDALYKQADPYEFGLVSKLRTALEQSARD